MQENPPIMGWLSQDDPEWGRAWAQFPDPLLKHPVTGECLQYMGSVYQDERGWLHTFRHRRYPATGQRQYWHLPATPGWNP